VEKREEVTIVRMFKRVAAAEKRGKKRAENKVTQSGDGVEVCIRTLPPGEKSVLTGK